VTSAHPWKPLNRNERWRAFSSGSWSSCRIQRNLVEEMPAAARLTPREKEIAAHLVSRLSRWMGVTLPGWTAFLLAADPANAELMFGRPAAQVLSGWVTLAEFLVERADMLSSLLRPA